MIYNMISHSTIVLFNDDLMTDARTGYGIHDQDWEKRLEQLKNYSIDYITFYISGLLVIHIKDFNNTTFIKNPPIKLLRPLLTHSLTHVYAKKFVVNNSYLLDEIGEDKDWLMATILGSKND